MQLTITGYSTALFSTWYFIEELGLLFDAGEGLTASLMQKSRKISHVFISHADRDHLTGLLQFNQLNARPGLPVILYPKHCGSFPALEEFSKKFDPHVTATTWKPIEAGSEIWIRDDIVITPVRNEHVPAGNDVAKSLGYKVAQTKRKVKPELAHLPGNEIKKLILEKGKEQTTIEVRTNLICYSGDTPVDDWQKWDHSKILIHEATFLSGDEHAKVTTHGNRHSMLEEVMEMVSNLQIEKLVLGHFSSRYSPEQIDRNLKQLCEKYAINIPVFRVLPGETFRDILNSKPVNQ